MTAQPLDGKATAAAIKTELTTRVAALRERGVVPGLATVLVGSDRDAVSKLIATGPPDEEVGMEAYQSGSFSSEFVRA